ncbi:MAG: 1,4-alpha-glucan branching protein domain-containing protein [Chloroflexaceae bacterium]
MHVAFLVLAHVPYLRRAGRRPRGEEGLHALVAQGLLPLLELLSDLHSSGLHPRIGLACSPLLVDQLADPVVQKHFVLWMHDVLARREAELASAERDGDRHGAYLGRFYLEWGRQRLRSFEERFQRNLPRAMRELAAARVIEPLAVPATYAYLPLLGREESVRAQIEQGVLQITRHLWRPEGLWLPGGSWRPGVEDAATDAGLQYLVADPSCLRATPAPPAVWLAGRRIAAIFPDEDLAQHIWSVELGYAGDPLYRDPADARGILARSGAPYDPYHALRRAQEHANHFATALVTEARRRGAYDLALVLIDAAQIGPTWVEGSTWLQAVLIHCATQREVRLTTPGAYVRAHRPREEVVLREGSWSIGGHAGWQGGAAEEYWQMLHAAEERMVQLASAYPGAEAERERVLNQAAREIMLAQTGDWPARLSAGVTDKTTGRWRVYLDRFEQLAEMARYERVGPGDLFLLEQLEEADGVFANLNYRIFAP